MKHFLEKNSTTLLVGLLMLCIGFMVGERLVQSSYLVCDYPQYPQYYYYSDPQPYYKEYSSGEQPYATNEMMPSAMMPGYSGDISQGYSMGIWNPGYSQYQPAMVCHWDRPHMMSGRAYAQ